MLTFQQLANIFEKSQNFVIISHINPDADAIGSELAFLKALQFRKKNAKIINHSETPDFVAFLDEQNEIEVYRPEVHDKIIENADVILIVDLSNLSRVGSVEEIIRKSNKTTIYFDHHQNPDDFTDLQIINTEKVAVGEMVFDFLTETQFAPISKQIANAIYTAILTDSGYFRYERTTSHTYNIAGILLEIGVNPKWIFEMLYEQNSLIRSHLLGFALISSELHGGGKICSITIRNDILSKLNANESDIEGITSYTLSIKNVRIGLVFVEYENEIKASFRSRGTIPMNKLASEFGGGGHINAAGIRLENINFDEIRNKIINRAIEYLDMEEKK